MKKKKDYDKPRNRKIAIVMLSATVIFGAFLCCIHWKNATSTDFIYTVSSDLLQYKNMTYAAYQELTGREMSFEHGELFAGEVPGKDVQVIMAGRYDEELAGYDLPEDSEVLRLQGRLADLISMEDADGKHQTEMTVEDFMRKMTGQSCGSLSYEFLEGAGTAYYVDNYYVSISFDSDEDGISDMLLEISLGSEAPLETVNADSYAWLYLSMPARE